MDDTEFDKELIRAAFERAERTGWHRMSVAAAAADALLPLDRARARFPSRLAVLMRFGSLADQAALADAVPDGSTRDKLFDLLMRRIDVLQAHRGGVLALLRELPADPMLALALNGATRRSMRWMLEAAGVSSTGWRGELRTRGLVAVWLWVIRSWRTDEAADLPATMAALDTTLTRAEQASSWLNGGGRSTIAPVDPLDEPPASIDPEPPADLPPDLPIAPFDAPPEPPPSPPSVL